MRPKIKRRVLKTIFAAETFDGWFTVRDISYLAKQPPPLFSWILRILWNHGFADRRPMLGKMSQWKLTRSATFEKALGLITRP